MSIDHLIYLVHKKNELNKKRLRFKRWARREKEGCISKSYAKEMADKASLDMRKMTETIRVMCKDLKVRQKWARYQWRVVAIESEQGTIKIESFKRHVMDYMAEQILLVKAIDQPQRGCLRNVKRQG